GGGQSPNTLTAAGRPDEAQKQQDRANALAQEAKDFEAEIERNIEAAKQEASAIEDAARKNKESTAEIEAAGAARVASAPDIKIATTDAAQATSAPATETAATEAARATSTPDTETVAERPAPTDIDPQILETIAQQNELAQTLKNMAEIVAQDAAAPEPKLTPEQRENILATMESVRDSLAQSIQAITSVLRPAEARTATDTTVEAQPSTANPSPPPAEAAPPQPSRATATAEATAAAQAQAVQATLQTAQALTVIRAVLSGNIQSHIKATAVMAFSDDYAVQIQFAKSLAVMSEFMETCAAIKAKIIQEIQRDFARDVASIHELALRGEYTLAEIEMLKLLRGYSDIPAEINKYSSRINDLNETNPVAVHIMTAIKGLPPEMQKYLESLSVDSIGELRQAMKGKIDDFKDALRAKDLPLYELKGLLNRYTSSEILAAINELIKEKIEEQGDPAQARAA
ncbi:hypothetical protein NO2_1647, partial [Candidatus Termititenax persephonae]